MIWDVVIVGAGMAGLSARKVLTDAGYRVLTLEKSRGMGGRMSTRRLRYPPEQGQEVLVDLGAQFASARGAFFQALLDRERGENGIREIRLQTDSLHPRYIHTRGMNQLPKSLLGHPDLLAISPVLKQAKVVRLRGERENSRSYWSIFCESPENPCLARSLILTSPLPQALELIRFSELQPEGAGFASCARVRYDRCLAITFILGADSGLPAPGILKNVSQKISGVFDQKKKGLVSTHETLETLDSVVVHLQPEASLKFWESAENEVAHEIWDEVKALLPRDVQRPLTWDFHRWRFCAPQETLPFPFLKLDLKNSAPLYLAGDAFGASRVEGAFESGRLAAQQLATENLAP
jgi:predicted NAD/FAD-dependent oxidoreductase